MKFINNRREERVSKETRKKSSQVTSPQINQNSKKMVKEKYGEYPQKRVDQRLYEDHRKRQIAQDMKQKLLERQCQAMANPKTAKSNNFNPTSSYHSIQTLSTGDGKEIVSRLLDYKSKYNENEEDLKQKYSDKE